MRNLQNSKQNLPVCWCVHDDFWFIQQSVRSFKSCGSLLALVSRVAWDGSEGCWERAAEEFEKAGVEVILGDWTDETMHRRAALQLMKERGYAHVLIPDTDEVIEPELLAKLCGIAKEGIAGSVRVHLATYWKSARYVISPPETLAPLMLIDARIAVHERIREYNSGLQIVLGADAGVLHHLSYAGPDERIVRKISTWGHKSEVAQDWYRRVWKGWDSDPLMRGLHPTHPPCYGMAERVEIPDILKGVWDERPVNDDPPVPESWPEVSIVIPVFGGSEDIKRCLESLEGSFDLIHEVVVVDDAGAVDAPAAIRMHLKNTELKLKLLQNEQNMGFAATCNRGYAASTGEVVVFLNSDTRTPRASLLRLIETLMSSGSVGAAGPLTNHAGYHQQIDPTYTDVSRLNLFAQDFAHRDEEDRDAEMLVGFCLAVKRSVIEELHEPPFDERFVTAFFEDNDLCHRIQRAGFRTRLSARAYVHHEGSKSIERLDVHPHVMLRKNQALYRQKWREDIESGFASHLSGESPEPIVFREDRRPDQVRKRLRHKAKRADVSVCLIVKNEEKVLADCLKSLQDAFTQIVVVDTGSTDRTREIAREHGAEVFDHPWQDSFSEARNNSLRHATGKWIFWVDADDVVPRATAEAVLDAAINGDPELIGYVVPVQFVEEGPDAGTRVDHVKLFRNHKKVHFQFRLHEQVLPSLRAIGGQLGRIDKPVLHQNYDTSEAGQKAKRERDWPLLLKDLEENPDHPFVLFNLGMTSYYTGRIEEAVDYLSRCIQFSVNGESHLRKAYALLGMTYMAIGSSPRDGSALDVFKRGIAAVGEDPEMRFHSAGILEKHGKLEEAADMYLQVAPLTDGSFSSMDIGIVGFKRSMNLGGLFLRMGNYPAARDWYRRARDEAPGRLDSSLALFDAALAAGDVQEALACAEAVHGMAGPCTEWASMRVRLAQLIGEHPIEALSRMVATRPNDQGPALLLARELLALGDERSAAPLLRRLMNHGCAEAAFHLGVMAVRAGDFKLAHRYTRFANQLDPNHEQTKEQLSKLEALLAEADSVAA